MTPYQKGFAKGFIIGFTAGTVVTATAYDLWIAHQNKRNAERAAVALGVLKEKLREQIAIINERPTMTENDAKFWKQVTE